MTKIIVNGDFLCRNLTGIERFAIEILNQLDKIIKKNDIAIFIPRNARLIPNYDNIKIIVSDKELKSFWSWQQFVYAFFLIKEKALGLDFSNNCPVVKPGIVFLHDIYCKLYSEDFSSFHDKLVKIYSCFMYKFVTKNAKKIITVSQFSKKQIVSAYKISPDKVTVIPNGWEHFIPVEPDNSIFENFPSLKPKQFYFTLGSLSKRKNLKWIAEYAQKHPEEHFAISGKAISGLVPDELKVLQTLPNVTLLGYVSDGQVKALMKNCRAFVFPSYYEGFGIPPLEALSVGARIVVSKSASLPEIYGDCAVYIDPNDTNVSLDALLSKPVAPAEPVLRKYTYKNAAKALHEVLQNMLQKDF